MLTCLSALVHQSTVLQLEYPGLCPCPLLFRGKQGCRSQNFMKQPTFSLCAAKQKLVLFTSAEIHLDTLKLGCSVVDMLMLFFHAVIPSLSCLPLFFLPMGGV